MLCPKGVRRYMQGSHPDRLLAPLLRAEGGFRESSWDEALGLTARRLKEIQERHGRDAVAVYGGASLTNEKAYIVGKFARMVLGTRHVDYNGRLCMVSAGTAYKLAFGVDRSPLPWSDIPKAQVLFVIGANIAECAPITTDYVWRCRDAGGKLIVADPRMTPVTRNADLYLPLRPGTDLVLLHVILRDKLENRAFIEAHTTGFEAAAASAKPYDPRTAADITGVPPEAIEKAAHWFARAERAIAMHARGLEHQSKGVENCLAVINLALATGHIGREGTGCTMITGQGNGQGGREHGQKCDQLPGQRSISDPEGRRHVARVWGHRTGPDPPGRADCRGDHGGDPPRGDQGPAPQLLQPAGLAAGRGLHPPGAGEAGVLRGDRLLHVRDRPPRRRGAARLPAGRGRGGGVQRRGPGHPHCRGGPAAGAGPPGLGDLLRPGRAPRSRQRVASSPV
jgi:assimilatory nitrate reductase catalytic subunit